MAKTLGASKLKKKKLDTKPLVGRVKITKQTMAAYGQGRGMDAGYDPPNYYVEKDGKRVGAIFGKSSRRGGTDWTVFKFAEGETLPQRIKSFSTTRLMRAGTYEGSPFKRAKEFAVEHFGNG